MIPSAACRYSGRNYPFWCAHCSTDSQLQTTPKIATSHGGVPTTSHKCFLAPPPASQFSKRRRDQFGCFFAGPNRQTALRVTSVTIGHIYALHVMQHNYACWWRYWTTCQG